MPCLAVEPRLAVAAPLPRPSTRAIVDKVDRRANGP
jgi:hypothetical protein